MKTIFEIAEPPKGGTPNMPGPITPLSAAMAELHVECERVRQAARIRRELDRIRALPAVEDAA